MSAKPPNLAYYSVYSNLWGGMTYASYVGPFPAPRKPDYPQYMLRRTFDLATMTRTWTLPPGTPPNPKFDILVSDVCTRMGNSPTGVCTNHIWGGDLTQGWLGYSAALSFESTTGACSVNYGMIDGSVRTFGTFTMGTLMSKMVTAGDGGVGVDTYCIPAAWRR